VIVAAIAAVSGIVQPYAAGLQQIDWQLFPVAIVAVATAIWGGLRLFLERLLSCARWLSQIDVHLAAIAFACLLVGAVAIHARMYPAVPVAPDTKVAEIASADTVVRRKGRPKLTVKHVPAVARVVGAPSHVIKSCQEQTWPYITGRCLTIADDQTRLAIINSEAAQPIPDSRNIRSTPNSKDLPNYRVRPDILTTLDEGAPIAGASALPRSQASVDTRAHRPRNDVKSDPTATLPADLRASIASDKWLNRTAR